MAEILTTPSLKTSTTTEVERKTEPASVLTPALQRHAVRLKTHVLTAIPVVKDHTVTLPLGTLVDARVGDWAIAKGEIVVDVVSPQEFKAKYEPTGVEGLVIRGDQRFKLERTLGVGSTETPETLTTAVERMGRLVIGDIRIDFTPGQWEHLQHRAEKMGLTPEQLTKRIVDRTTSEFFDQV